VTQFGVGKMRNPPVSVVVLLLLHVRQDRSRKAVGQREGSCGKYRSDSSGFRVGERGNAEECLTVVGGRESGRHGGFGKRPV
jgi:hypothetical protein